MTSGFSAGGRVVRSVSEGRRVVRFRAMDARHDVWQHARKMWEAGLVVASAGNVSRRIDESRIAITPTSIAYDVMTPEQVMIVDLKSGETIDSTHRPSYELPMHLA